MTSVGAGGTGVAAGGCGGWVGMASGSGEAPPHPTSNKVTSMIPTNCCSFLVFNLIYPFFASRKTTGSQCLLLIPYSSLGYWL